MKQIISIGANEFIKGASISNYLSNGGFSPESLGFDVGRMDEKIGLLLPGQTLTEYSTNLADNIMASVPYFRNNAFYYYSIGDKGNIYETVASITVSHTVKHTETGHSKAYGNDSGIIIYYGELFISSETDIYKDDLTFTVNDYDWWTTVPLNSAGQNMPALTSGVPHILFDFGDRLHITNGNLIARWDGTEAVNNALKLPNGWKITDVEINGTDIYITAVYGSQNSSYNLLSKIFVWDGKNTDALREVPFNTPGLNVIVKSETGFLLFAGKSIFFFDGYNYTWIRNMTEGTTREKVVSYKGVIYFVDYGKVWAYNTRFKSFYCPLNPALPANAVITCMNIGFNDQIDLFVDVATAIPGKFYRTTTQASGMIFYSNWYEIINTSVEKMEIVFGPTFSEPIGYGLKSGADYTVNIYNFKNEIVHTKNIVYNADYPVCAIDYQLTETLKSSPVFRFEIIFNSTTCSPIKLINIYGNSINQ